MKKRLVEALSDRDLYMEDRFAAWPSIARGKRGELALVFSGRREFHIDPFGEIVLLVSDDDGKIWSDPVVLESTPLDNRDPGIVQLESGEWLVSFCSSTAYMDWVSEAQERYGDESIRSWDKSVKRTTAELIDRFSGKFLLSYESLDSMMSGSDSEIIDTIVNTPHGPIEVEGEGLLMVGIDNSRAPVTVRCVYSGDRGQSWQIRSDLSLSRLDEGIHLHEPDLVDLGEGRLQAWLRTNVPKSDPQLLYRSLSSDYGRSWSDPEPTEIEGVPPHILRCEDGTLVMVYGYRRPPYGIRCVISQNSGVSWSEPRVLMEFEEKPPPENVGPDESEEVYYQMPDFGYPASVQLSDRSILTVYYGPSAEGERTGISVIHWKL